MSNDENFLKFLVRSVMGVIRLIIRETGSIGGALNALFGLLLVVLIIVYFTPSALAALNVKIWVVQVGISGGINGGSAAFIVCFVALVIYFVYCLNAYFGYEELRRAQDRRTRRGRRGKHF